MNTKQPTQCKACPVTLDGYSPSNEAVQIQEPGQSTQEQQAQAWRAVWEVLQEVKPGFDDCYPLSGQEAAIKTIRELAAVQQGVQQIKANCYSDDDGDSWCDNPYECDFPKGLKVGETFELQASIRSWSETFRVTKAPDDGNDDYEVELVSSDAPFATHPTQKGK